MTSNKTLLDAARQSGRLIIATATNTLPTKPTPVTPGVRVLVCGGRNDADHTAVDLLMQTVIARFGPIACVIHGAATGADTLGKEWALKNHIEDAPYPADWNDLTRPDALIRTRRDDQRYDARAGFRRNQRMIDEGKPNVVVALPGGNGTADMVARARKAGPFKSSASKPQPNESRNHPHHARLDPVLRL